MASKLTGNSTLAGRRYRLPLASRFRPFECLIEFGLLGCSLLSIAITVAMAATVIYGSVQFFLDPHVSIWYFFTGKEWTAGFADAKYGILPLALGTLSVAVIAIAVA